MCVWLMPASVWKSSTRGLREAQGRNEAATGAEAEVEAVEGSLEREPWVISG